MLHFTRIAGPVFSLLFLPLTMEAQTAAPKFPMAAEKIAVAATVNGHSIPEFAVERALQGVPTDERAKARQEVLQFLIDNSVIDQYLAALKIAVEAKEIDQQMANFREDLKKNNQDFDIVLKKMKVTETELKEQIYNQLRWEHFVTQQATDEKLKALFNHMPEAFDGSTIRARHILLATGTTPKEKEDAQAKLKEIRAQIDKDVAAGLAKLPADADNLTKEKLKLSLLDDAFGDAAKKNSICPSKADGGDLRWFPRYGSMVEPFAKVAFALKEHQISEPVTTPFGYHLILVTGRKPGVPTKFEDPKVKEAVKEVYEARLKEAVLDQMKPRAKIEIAQIGRAHV
jgi:peptidyl-prolyl cis-trans isomerase C